jgi:hypothetical protein
MDKQDLANRFSFHPATPDTGPKHDDVRVTCLDLAGDIDDGLPDSREKSLAITHLEEVMFWWNAAIARGGK